MAKNDPQFQNRGTNSACKFCGNVSYYCKDKTYAEPYCPNFVKETIHHPQHYGGDTPYECIKVLEAWLQPEQFIGFLRGNSLKYLARAGKKGENYEEDLRKAIWYANYETEFRKRWSAGLIGEHRFEFTERKPNP
jgi:hypothetical protein